MRASGRCALAKWAWRGSSTSSRSALRASGFVLQQLLYAEEVRASRSSASSSRRWARPSSKLAMQLIDQIAEDSYDPTQFVDEEKQRILAAIERKIAGKQVVARAAAPLPGAQVIDLIAALRASLGALAPTAERHATSAPVDARERKPARRAAKAPAATAPPIKRARGRQIGPMNDLSAFPITRKWPARHPDRLQLYSLPTPNGVKVSIMLEETGLPYEPHRVASTPTTRSRRSSCRSTRTTRSRRSSIPNGPGGRPLGAVRIGRDPALPGRKDRPAHARRRRPAATRRSSG